MPTALALVLVSAITTATLAVICTKAGKPPGIGIGILKEKGILRMTSSDEASLVGLPAVNERFISPTIPLFCTDADVVAPPAMATSALVRNRFTKPAAVICNWMPLIFLLTSATTSRRPASACLKVSL